MGDALIMLPPDCRMVRFADAPELTANALHPQSDDEPLTQTMKRQMCRDDHERLLRSAARDGIIIPLNPHSYVPVPDWERAQLMRAVMTRADFERLAEIVLVRVECSPPRTASNGRELTLVIQGREALPVRAIPEVAGWRLCSPDALAKYFAWKTDKPPALRNLSTYCMQGDVVTPFYPERWDAVVIELTALEALLYAQFRKVNDRALGEAAWRAQAPLKLPRGVFVWVDEFRDHFIKDFARVLTGVRPVV